ncbi:EscU/YscU/HrcU family type III secretion system export apparatus switch protein, partial [Salmonella enterica subsp. enterica serovar Anatum]|nr:EscU/YscU/HrcU family type III secretion system export apparatus switch protein [Salmonella enterica subsp. enterica serovar Anatum]
LSEQVKSDIENSRLIVANPTHITIGIYFKPELMPIPMISVYESDHIGDLTPWSAAIAKLLTGD